MTDALATPFDVRLMNITANALFVVCGAVVLAALGHWAANRATFAIGAITVTGDVAHRNVATLRANVVPRLGGSFLTLDLTHAKQVFESLPWVRRAIVQRQFPNRLKVILFEQQPVAYWGAEGDSRLLNNFGEVFEANIDEVDREGLPHLDGPPGQGPQVLAMYQTLQPLFDALDVPLEQLRLTGRGSWEAMLSNGAQIEIGRGTDAEIVARAERFLKTVTQITSRYDRRPDALESADLRYPSAYALRMRGVSTVAPEAPKK